MAYFSQQMKKERAPAVKAVLAKYGMKGTMSVDNHSSFVVTVKSGSIPFEQHEQVNTYWIEHNYGVGTEATKFLTELKEAMNIGNYDNSDLMSDYHDVGFYVDINIGTYNKPYVLVK